MGNMVISGDIRDGAWNPVEPYFIILLVVVQLSVVLFLLVHGRNEKSFRQAFYTLFISVTLVDCFVVVTRPAEYITTPFGVSIDALGFTYYFSYLCVPPFVHAQSLLQTAVALNRFTAICFPLKHRSIWTCQTVVLVLLATLALSLLLGAGATAFYGIRNVLSCPTRAAIDEMSDEQYDQVYDDLGYCVLVDWTQYKIDVDYAVIALSSSVCCTASVALSMCAVTVLLVRRVTGKLHRHQTEFRLFVHSLFMFLVQLFVAVHQFVLFNDQFDGIALSLGAKYEDIFLPGEFGPGTGESRWRPIKGWLYDCGIIPANCSALQHVIRGDAEIALGLKARALTQHVFGLSGSVLLLIISGHVRTAYFRFYFNCMRRKNSLVIRVLPQAKRV